MSLVYTQTNPSNNMDGWLVVLGFNTTLTAKVISWRQVTHMFPGFLTPVLTQLFFPKPPTSFLTCFCRGERRNYAGKKSHLNQGTNSQPPGHESNTLTTELPGRGPNMELQGPKISGFLLALLPFCDHCGGLLDKASTS